MRKRTIKCCFVLHKSIELMLLFFTISNLLQVFVVQKTKVFFMLSETSLSLKALRFFLSFFLTKPINWEKDKSNRFPKTDRRNTFAITPLFSWFKPFITTIHQFLFYMILVYKYQNINLLPFINFLFHFTSQHIVLMIHFSVKTILKFLTTIVGSYGGMHLRN